MSDNLQNGQPYMDKTYLSYIGTLTVLIGLISTFALYYIDYLLLWNVVGPGLVTLGLGDEVPGTITFAIILLITIPFPILGGLAVGFLADTIFRLWLKPSQQSKMYPSAVGSTVVILVGILTTLGFFLFSSQLLGKLCTQLLIEFELWNTGSLCSFSVFIGFFVSVIGGGMIGSFGYKIFSRV